MKCPVMPGCARFCPLSGEGGRVSIHRIEDLKTGTETGKVRGSGAEDSAGSRARGEFDSKGFMEIQNPIEGKQ